MVPAFPAGVAAHVTRLRMTGTNRLAFDQLLPRIEDAARALTDARCDVVVFHCTANSMEGGKTGEEQILATLAQAGAPRATTTITAIQRAFSALGARRIVLITPYSVSTTEHEADFLRKTGYDVLSAQGFALDGSDAYCATPPQFWHDRVVAASASRCRCLSDQLREYLGFRRDRRSGSAAGTSDRDQQSGRDLGGTAPDRLARAASPSRTSVCNEFRRRSRARGVGRIVAMRGE